MRDRLFLGLFAGALALAACSTPGELRSGPAAASVGEGAVAQVPGWSRGDMELFLHGSMSAEFVPERVLRAFIATYPDLFPRPDLSAFGLIPDPDFGWPLGMSRRPVTHLGGLSSVGVNCAACHVGLVAPASGGAPVRVLGMTAQFDAEAFFNSVIAATFFTASPANMPRFLEQYLAAGEPGAADAAPGLVAARWQAQQAALTAAIAADPAGTAGIGPDALHQIAAADLALDRARLETGQDLVPLVRSLLRLFHNIRAALHIPDQLPAALPPASGPGRNDAFGLLSAALFGVPQPYAPVKFGLLWHLDSRRWVHWDGNTQSPIGRNLLAALGLGAPLIGAEAQLDLALVQRQTDLSERIRAPRYPFAVDQAAAGRGAAVYRARCASCHDGAEDDSRLHAVEQVRTDPSRARAFTQPQADRFNQLLAGLRTPGYAPASAPGIRGTGRYWAPRLAGVWARSPYLHNGSVRTMDELLMPPAARATTFRRGSPAYDERAMGYRDEGPYVLDTRSAGNGNGGHEYGADLAADARRDLIEYLKTL